MSDRDSDTTTDDSHRGRGTGPPEADEKRDGDGWLDGPAVLEAPLPEDLQSALGRFVGRESVETLGEWTAEVRRVAGGGAIDVEQLCHADGETDHWGTAGGEQYYFQCFYDAVILAAVEDRPVDIHTVSPGGTVVEARAVGGEELSVEPAEAVFSFGIATDPPRPSDGTPTLQDGYAAVCPYVRAFPDREAYDRWADGVPAATVALPLAGATEVADALVA